MFFYGFAFRRSVFVFAEKHAEAAAFRLVGILLCRHVGFGCGKRYCFRACACGKRCRSLRIARLFLLPFFLRCGYGFVGGAFQRTEFARKHEMTDYYSAEVEYGIKNPHAVGYKQTCQKHDSRAYNCNKNIGYYSERLVRDHAFKSAHPGIGDTGKSAFRHEREEYQNTVYSTHLKSLLNNVFFAGAYSSLSTLPSKERLPSATENELIFSSLPLTESGPSLVTILIAAGEESVTFSTPVIRARLRDSRVILCLFFSTR